MSSEKSLGKTMVGGTLCEVLESKAPGYSKGELVLGYTYAVNGSVTNWGDGAATFLQPPRPSTESKAGEDWAPT